MPRQELRPRSRVAIGERRSKVLAAVLENPTATWDEIGKKAGISGEKAAFTFQADPVQELYKNLMNKHKELQDEALITKLKDGLTAKTTKFFAFEGEVTETREIDDTHLQKEYLELALRLKGAPGIVNRVEVTGRGGGPVAIAHADLSFLTLTVLEQMLTRLSATAT